MKITLTGSAGFLGWHTRARLHTLTDHEVTPVTRENWSQLKSLVAESDAVLHLAGVNRADTDDQVASGNLDLARDLADAVRSIDRPIRIVYASSTQVGNGSPYGKSKEEAGELLRAAAADVGGVYVEVRLPGVFGEHARPHYNTFVATFIELLGRGEQPSVNDNPVELIHAQAAAAALIEGLSSRDRLIRAHGHQTRVPEVLSLLESFHDIYGRGEIPKLPTQFHTDLFNTYRAAQFPAKYPFSLMVNADNRGELIETMRAHGSGGQSFVSWTHPEQTRGEHYHLSKIERFVVLSGHAHISLRKVLTDEVITFDVTGERPAVIDMPTLWVHNITNVGTEPLITMFWADQLFNPAAPDTYWEPVEKAVAAV
ncbi:NAD-dependent epimerase/dehydratase family protein [Allobranchiibius sp. CTAmp26]|uniref:polysaccharide biosynthesis C-terminal domain-containing protein n=1 Tax=Allobranchiibius sp. CTAmp26 TaxID=2815214 RepID=UPI001AA0C1FD|nr:NAD-dependent epimerase/dehydratase family protein [Allobranchiibius sp. CTAmp26]MBO1755770.1 NAD-dependent epimerase/dehydratase family protein [Allobranchiibius sp. CTAmp26]